MEEQVKSKQRVADHGEVLTGRREVNAMLDLVKQETERIESRFLEPASGTGNFLAPILERKLAVVEKRYGKSQLDLERYVVLAVSSIYGIDIQEDNVQHCRQWLFGIFNLVYLRLFKNRTKDACREVVRFIPFFPLTMDRKPFFLQEGDTRGRIDFGGGHDCPEIRSSY